MTLGILLSVFGLGGVLYTISIRKLQIILNEVGFVAVGASILFIFFVGLPMMNATALIGVWCVLGGIGFYMFHNTLQTKATEMYPQARGTAISVFAMSLFSGQAVGTIIFGILSTAYGYAISFVTVAVCMLVLGRFFMKKLRTNLHSNQRPEI
jgi:predicted MFS family arabinose efflux permease